MRDTCSIFSLKSFCRFCRFIVLICLATQTLTAQDTKLNPGGMKTRWGKSVSPANAWREYPRPQLVRSSWQNLNGLWDYAITDRGATMPGRFDGKILVPYCIESSLSGVQKQVLPSQQLWYKNSISIPAQWAGKNIILHFDAVDWETRLWINGREAGVHRGGSDPFSFDITPYLIKGKQEIVLAVWDPTDTDAQPRGKQVLNPQGIWYTPVTGIWQTVWMEPVEKTHIQSLLPQADIDHNLVWVKADLAAATGSEKMMVKVMKDKKLIAQKTGDASTSISLSIPGAKLWTPDSPSLYQLEVTLLDGSRVLDKAQSYFAMRKISHGMDEFGYNRLLLNNKPLFQYGTLDQGWWPDGLLTPPSDAAMRYDIDVLKKMGFNMLRKHIKVEPSRYYYYADSVGLLIWQDMPSGFETAKRDVQQVDWQDEKDWDRPPVSSWQFESEWKSIMDHLRFFPSIVVWVPFNEGWGQYDTKRVVEWTMHYDTTRVIDGVSGWTDRNVGHMNDAHHYPGPGMEPANLNPGRVIVLGEFGGLGLPLQDHLWNPGMRNWGYRTYKTREELEGEYAKLMKNLYPMINRGLSGAIYTQTTDVEGEVNGLITYDREVIKFDESHLTRLHAPLYLQPVKSSVLIPDALSVPGTSRQMAKVTASGSASTSEYSSQPAPVKLEVDGHYKMLEKFQLSTVPDHLQLRFNARGDVKAWLNGTLVLSNNYNTGRHYAEINLDEFRSSLKKGENEILFEIENVKGNTPFDFSLYTY